MSDAGSARTRGGKRKRNTDADDADGEGKRQKTGGRQKNEECPSCGRDFTTTANPIIKKRDQQPLLQRRRGYGSCDCCLGALRFGKHKIGEKELHEKTKTEEGKAWWNPQLTAYENTKNGLPVVFTANFQPPSSREGPLTQVHDRQSIELGMSYHKFNFWPADEYYSYFQA